MSVSDYTTKKLIFTSWVWICQGNSNWQSTTPAHTKKSWDLLQPLRYWVDHLKVDNCRLAHLICRLIPAQCPFERDIKLFGRTLFHIPPMCKLNPLYEEVVGLRFRALCYLADECGEDISTYC